MKKGREDLPPSKDLFFWSWWGRFKGVQHIKLRSVSARSRHYFEFHWWNDENMRGKKFGFIKLPFWLRKLDLVKKELQGIHWPSTEDGLRQGMTLMALGLEILEKRNRNTPAIFAKIDERWIKQWKKDRARLRRST